MALLPDTEREAVWKEMMAEASSTRASLDLTKTDLRAVVDAMDAWMNSNAASLNAAIPLPARTALTPAQKVQLFAAVVLKRYVRGA